MFIVIAADLCIPYMQKEFLDGGIIKGNHNVIFYTIVGILLMSLIKATFGYCKEYFYDLISSDVHEDIKNDLFNHLQKLEFKYFDGMNTGELMSRIGEDAENIWQTIGYGLRLFVENIIYFVFSTIILFSLNWELTLACIAVMIPIGIIEVKLEKVFGDCYGKISDKTAEINTTAQENIAGVRLVKAEIILVGDRGEVDLGVGPGHEGLVEIAEPVGSVGDGAFIQGIFQLGGGAVCQIDRCV